MNTNHWLLKPWMQAVGAEHINMPPWSRICELKAYMRAVVRESNNTSCNGQFQKSIFRIFIEWFLKFHNNSN